MQELLLRLYAGEGMDEISGPFVTEAARRTIAIGDVSARQLGTFANDAAAALTFFRSAIANAMNRATHAYFVGFAPIVGLGDVDVLWAAYELSAEENIESASTETVKGRLLSFLAPLVRERHGASSYEYHTLRLELLVVGGADVDEVPPSAETSERHPRIPRGVVVTEIRGDACSRYLAGITEADRSSVLDIAVIPISDGSVRFLKLSKESAQPLQSCDGRRATDELAELFGLRPSSLFSVLQRFAKDGLLELH